MRELVARVHPSRVPHLYIAVTAFAVAALLLAALVGGGAT